MTEHTYTVVGHWPFPLDMLRHDGSRAASEADQALIDRLSGDHAPDKAAFLDVSITLTGPNKPNTARWESFTWSIPADLEWADTKRRMAEERQRDALRKSGAAKLTQAERDALGIKDAA